MEATEPKTDEQIMQGLLQTEEPEAPAEEPTEEVEAEAETEEEASEQDAEEEAEEAEEPDEDESEPEADEQPATFTVKVDGKEQQVTLEELTRGYAGQAYIQKGMTEAAELRKKTDAEAQSLSQERQQLAKLVQTLQETGLSQPTAPDIAMLQTDPIGYMEAKAKYDSDMAEYGQKVQGLRDQHQKHQEAEYKRRMAYRAEQEQILTAAIPDFADPEKGPALQKKLRSTGEAYGFSAEEIEGIADARHVQVLHDAMRYRDTMAKKDAVAKKAEKARPVAKAGAKKAQPSARERNDKLRQRARQGDESAVLDLLFNPEGI